MLYALEHPAALAVLVLSFVGGLTLRGYVEALVATRMGDARPRQEHRLRLDPRVHLDPFGVVAALIVGLGWSRPVELLRPRRKALLLGVNLTGPLVNVALGVGSLIAWRALEGPVIASADGASSLLQHGIALETPERALLLLGLSQLYLGALALVPLPPLEGSRVLFGLAPRTHGWLRAEHELVERNIGVVVLLALLVIPLGGPTPLLPSLLDTVLSARSRA